MLGMVICCVSPVDCLPTVLIRCASSNMIAELCMTLHVAVDNESRELQKEWCQRRETQAYVCNQIVFLT